MLDIRMSFAWKTVKYINAATVNVKSNSEVNAKRVFISVISNLGFDRSTVTSKKSSN